VQVFLQSTDLECGFTDPYFIPRPKISERKFIQFTVGDLDKIHILGRLRGYVLSW
jgi:hypothetical protein